MPENLPLLTLETLNFPKYTENTLFMHNIWDYEMTCLCLTNSYFKICLISQQKCKPKLTGASFLLCEGRLRLCQKLTFYTHSRAYYFLHFIAILNLHMASSNTIDSLIEKKSCMQHLYLSAFNTRKKMHWMRVSTHPLFLHSW